MKRLFCMIFAIVLINILLMSYSVSALPSAVESLDVATETYEFDVNEDDLSDAAILAESSGACGSSLTYTLDTDGTLTISGSGNMYTWRRANLVSWYSARKLIKKVIIEDGVTNIGRYAFNSCENLESIVVSDSVSSIGDEAFYGCKKLSEIEGANGVKSIGSSAFYGCALLSELTVYDGVTVIGPYTFYGCTQLKTLNLPDSIEKIGEEAFYGCEKLTEINLGSGITSLPDYIFFGCASLTGVEIPEGVTSIGISAFEGCAKLTKADIPENTETIGENAFKGCIRLVSAKIPEGIEYLSDGMFDGCTRLTDVTFPETLVSIGYRCFADCTWLEEITIPDSVKNIAKKAFYACSSLLSINIPDNVTSIGSEAFRDCDYLERVSIGKGVTSIGNKAFFSCENLEEINVSEYNMYYYNDEQGVLFDRLNKSLVQYPAWNVLESYKVPDGIAAVEEGAFAATYHLKSIELPSSVTTVGASAFIECSRLAGVKIPDSVVKIGKGIIGSSCTLYGNAGSYVEEYAQANELNFEVLTGDIIQPTKIYLSSTSFYTNVGSSAAFTATVAPHFEGYTTNENVVWTSANKDVATVDNGLISAIAKGSTYVYVYSEDGGCLASVWVSVSQPVTGVELDKEKVTLRVGETETVTATVYPENASSKYVYWSSSDTNVARVLSGKITAIGLGTAVITARTSSGSFIDTVEVNVVEYVLGEINGDNEIDMNDAILLLQHSMFPELYPIEYAGSVDFTNDGNIDMNDAILLLQHSMFPELYPLTSSFSEKKK